MTVTRDDIVRVAMSWQGVPWVAGGHTRAGVNCVGLLVGIAGELGLDDLVDAFAPFVGLARPALPGRLEDQIPNRYALLRAFREHLVWTPFAERDAGDVLLIPSREQVPKQRQLTHVALLLRDDHLIESTRFYRGARVRLRHERPHSVWRLPALAEAAP